MSKKEQKAPKGIVKTSQKANGKQEYYISTAPQKTFAGKVIIWVLILLMALGSVGSLIFALITLAK